MCSLSDVPWLFQHSDEVEETSKHQLDFSGDGLVISLYMNVVLIKIQFSKVNSSSGSNGGTLLLMLGTWICCMMSSMWRRVSSTSFREAVYTSLGQSSAFTLLEQRMFNYYSRRSKYSESVSTKQSGNFTCKKYSTYTKKDVCFGKATRITQYHSYSFIS